MSTADRIPPGEPTEDDAMRYGSDFLTAVEAIQRGDIDTVVDKIAGPETDDASHVRHLCMMFSTSAVIAGRAARRAMAAPDDTSPMDGHAVLEIGDVRTGLPCPPEDLPPTMRVTVWALAAGANLDVEGIGGHLRTLVSRGGPEAVSDGILTLAQITAACWHGERIG